MVLGRGWGDVLGRGKGGEGKERRSDGDTEEISYVTFIVIIPHVV